MQPFGNIMQTVTMTGAQLDAVLEQQWRTGASRITLQISSGLSYTMDETRAIDDRVNDLELNGTPIDPAASYRVSINNFLAGGGDGFTRFTAGHRLSRRADRPRCVRRLLRDEQPHLAAPARADHQGRLIID